MMRQPIASRSILAHALTSVAGGTTPPHRAGESAGAARSWGPSANDPACAATNHPCTSTGACRPGSTHHADWSTQLVHREKRGVRQASYAWR